MAGAYEVLRCGDDEAISVIFPDPATRGLVVAVNSLDATTGEITARLATNTDKEILGFLARNITAAGGPTLADQVFNKGLESADKAGGYTSVEDVEWFAIEGTANLDATHPPTAKGDLVNFKAGLPQIAQSGEYYQFVVVDVITAVVEGNTNRFVLKAIEAAKAA